MLNRLRHASLLLGILCFGCSDGEEDRQERVTTLRTFGMSSSPLIPAPTTDSANPSRAIVTIHAAVPLGATASIAAFQDSGSTGGAFPVPLTDINVEAGSEQYTDYNSFRLFTARASIKIPPAILLARGEFKGAQIRYGLTITSGAEHENVVANIGVFPAGSPESTWENPSAEISSLSEGLAIAPSDDIDLIVVPGNEVAEDIKIGWFVSSGEVTNRRAAQTKWKLEDKGPQTVAVSVRGAKSHGFALKVINVTGN